MSYYDGGYDGGYDGYDDGGDDGYEHGDDGGYDLGGDSYDYDNGSTLSTYLSRMPLTTPQFGSSRSPTFSSPTTPYSPTASYSSPTSYDTPTLYSPPSPSIGNLTSSLTPSSPPAFRSSDWSFPTSWMGFRTHYPSDSADLQRHRQRCMVNDLELNPNSTFEQRRDNSVRQNDNLMDEVYLASQFLDLPYEVNAGLTSAAKYGEAARPIARVNQRKSMGRFGLKDKHLTEDDQRRLDEAAGLDEKSLMKLFKGKAKGVVTKPFKDLAKDEIHHQAAAFAATHPDTIHHLATSVEPIVHAVAPIADAVPHVGVFTKGWKFIKGTSKAVEGNESTRPIFLKRSKEVFRRKVDKELRSAEKVNKSRREQREFARDLDRILE